MKCFLASSLCFVDDIITQHIELQGKKVGCIRNAAKQRGGVDARRNQRDRDFLVSAGAVLVDIDVETEQNRDEMRNEIDHLFVGGGDTLYLRDLSESSGLHTHIHGLFEQGGCYMGTSAGSMLACTEVYYPHPGRQTQGLGLLDQSIIPHRASPSFTKERGDNFNNMFTHGTSYILLTDIDVLILQDTSHSIHRSQIHTLQGDVAEKIAEYVDE